MGVPGRRPKPAGERRNRHQLAHEWTEVEDTPYDGDVPHLPPRYVTNPETGKMQRALWPAATRRWWQTLSAMPHCRLWTPADWQYALDAAELHARWVTGGKHATEMRIREKQMGTTLDARRALRIQYVPAKAKSTEQAGPPAGVVNLDDYRDLYG